MHINESFEVDRDAIRDLHRMQNLNALSAAVERGEWTLQEAAQAHEAFLGSIVLQLLIELDVQILEAVLSGQVH